MHALCSAISTPGIHECAFRLCVHQEHCAQDELAKALAANRLRPDTWREQLGPAHPLYPGISGLAHGADAEAQANERRGSAARGRVITYGERVQLLHTWSGRLVTVIREHSEQNPQGMLIQLVEHLLQLLLLVARPELLQHRIEALQHAHRRGRRAVRRALDPRE